MVQEKAIQEVKCRMQKAVQFTTSEFATIHAGKASAAMVEMVSVDVYGSSSRLKDIAAITTPDARTISIHPWDNGTTKAIEKALLVANLGFTPVVDSSRVRCTIPEMSMERRKEMIKRAAAIAEMGRVSIRNIRKETNEVFKKQQKTSEISEDDLKRYEKDVQKLTDDAIGEIDKLLQKKEQELLTV
ncbi:MAG: ribosome recycling factor [Puniceicoccales bacterium]|jgi:ribosome recycling factor|nr:ribosome recycling factor [Puniceicoccales bacterium]